jgi:hypothetical protein
MLHENLQESMPFPTPRQRAKRMTEKNNESITQSNICFSPLNAPAVLAENNFSL